MVSLKIALSLVLVTLAAAEQDWGAKDGAAASSCTATHDPRMPGALAPTRACINSSPANSTRCWWSYAPAAVQAATAASPTYKAPLVIDMHGGGGCASDQVRASGFKEYADAKGADGFVVVWPQGYGTQWGMCGADVAACDAAGAGKQVHAVDDVAFLEQMIAHIVGAAAAAAAVDGGVPIDPTRVYLTGFSQGCMMSHRMALEKSKIIAGFGCTGGALMGVGGDAAAWPAVQRRFDLQPMPAYLSIGSDDPWYSANDVPRWGAWNGCSRTSTEAGVALSPAPHPGMPTTATRTTAAACAAYAPELEVHELTLTGAGHTTDTRMAQYTYDFLSRYRRAQARANLPEAPGAVAPPPSSATPAGPAGGDKDGDAMGGGAKDGDDKTTATTDWGSKGGDAKGGDKDGAWGGMKGNATKDGDMKDWGSKGGKDDKPTTDWGSKEGGAKGGPLDKDGNKDGDKDGDKDGGMKGDKRHVKKSNDKVGRTTCGPTRCHRESELAKNITQCFDKAAAGTDFARKKAPKDPAAATKDAEEEGEKVGEEDASAVARRCADEAKAGMFPEDPADPERGDREWDREVLEAMMDEAAEFLHECEHVRGAEADAADAAAECEAGARDLFAVLGECGKAKFDWMRDAIRAKAGFDQAGTKTVQVYTPDEVVVDFALDRAGGEQACADLPKLARAIAGAAGEGVEAQDVTVVICNNKLVHKPQDAAATPAKQRRRLRSTTAATTTTTTTTGSSSAVTATVTTQSPKETCAHMGGTQGVAGMNAALGGAGLTATVVGASVGAAQNFQERSLEDATAAAGSSSKGKGGRQGEKGGEGAPSLLKPDTWPGWALPVAIGGGGTVAGLLLAGIVVCLCRRRRAAPALPTTATQARRPSLKDTPQATLVEGAPVVGVYEATPVQALAWGKAPKA